MTKTLVRVAAPEQPIVSLEAAKAHVVVDYDDDDELINSIIHAAMNEIDGKDGTLGRALITQTWELRLDYFPCSIEIPLPPLQSVTSIKYLDTDGVEQTLATATYSVFTDAEPGRIDLAYGQTWPATRCVAEAVRVRFVAGYADDPDDVPELIRHWLKIRIATLYEHREEFIVGTVVRPTPGVSHMLASYRVL